MPSFSCTVEAGVPPEFRLDRYAAEYLKLLSRSQIKARNLKALVNGKNVKVSRILRAGDRLELSWEDAAPINLVPEDLPLDVVFENSRVIVVNKRQGMVVHPGAGNFTGTLANALLYRRLRRPGGTADTGAEIDSGDPPVSLRPGIVHRLDKDTSGLLIAAWDGDALAFLADQFKNRTVKKTYAAIVNGRPAENSGRIEEPIARNPRDRKRFTVTGGGRPSLTLYKVVKTWGSHSLLLLRPKTGRTHQIRVHLKWLGHPVLGDPFYGSPCGFFPAAALMLHAKRLSVILPGESEPAVFKTGFPPRFREVLKTLDSGKQRL
jgi:23S rRNA pseudouridine1911/1915/1917 synthase